MSGDRLKVDAAIELPNSYSVTGSVSVSNFPSNQAVTISNATMAVTGNFYQATQPVSLLNLPSLAAGTNAIGSITNTTFAATQSGNWTVTVANNQIPVTGTFYPEVQAVSLPSLPSGNNTIGSIANTTFAATQSGIWNVNVSNNSLPVTGTFWQAVQPVSFSALPAGSNTIGAISNTAFAVSGTLPAFASPPTVNIGTIPTVRNQPVEALTSTLTNVASSASSVTLITALGLLCVRVWVCIIKRAVANERKCKI